MEDAQKAGLQGKSGPWSQYPKRMRQMRARAFALRDVFPDVLRGMPIAEEVMDTPAERDITPRSQPAQKAPAALPDYTEAQMQENKAAWREAIQAGKTRAERIISMVSSKYTLTDNQKQAIRNLEPLEPEKDAFVADMERAEQEQDQ